LPEAVPVKAPTKVVEARDPVLGLKVNLLLEVFSGKLPEVVVTHVGNIVAFVEVSSVIPTLVELVALVAEVADVADVAVVAFPAKVVAVRVDVLGLKVILELEILAGKFPVVVVTQRGYIVALVVVSSVIPILVELVEDVEEVELVALVAVLALPERAPLNVVVVKVFVEGLKNNPVAVSIPWFPLVLEETNVGKKLAFVLFVAVVAAFVEFVALVAVVAEVALVAVLAFPVKAPANVVAVTVPVKVGEAKGAKRFSAVCRSV